MESWIADGMNSTVAVTRVGIRQCGVKYEQKSRHRYHVYANRRGRNIDEQDVTANIRPVRLLVLSCPRTHERFLLAPRMACIYTIHFTHWISLDLSRIYLANRSIMLISIYFVSPLIIDLLFRCSLRFPSLVTICSPVFFLFSLFLCRVSVQYNQIR